MRNALALLAATLLLLGAPALLLVEDLRDPACPLLEDEAAQDPFRSRAVENHRIARCLVPAADPKVFVAAAEKPAGRPLADPAW